MAEPCEKVRHERQEAVQRGMAMKAKDPAIARVHSDLADLYGRQARDMRQLIRLVR